MLLTAAMELTLSSIRQLTFFSQEVAVVENRQALEESQASSEEETAPIAMEELEGMEEAGADYAEVEAEDLEESRQTVQTEQMRYQDYQLMAAMAEVLAEEQVDSLMVVSAVTEMESLLAPVREVEELESFLRT